MTNTPRTKFVELAQKRMNKAIKAIRDLAQLDIHRGKYDAGDVEAMVKTLEREVEFACGRLAKGTERAPDFRLGTGGEE